MRIFVYEFVTGGGWYSHAEDSPPASLASEGRAMRDALAADFAAINGTHVEILRDARQDDVALTGISVHSVDSALAETQAIESLAAEADWTVLIAPEFERHLLARTQTAERADGRLLCPPSRVVALCTDKHATAQHLARHGISTPCGTALEAGSQLPVEFAYPAVLKPRQGAGSLGIERIDRWPPGRTIDKACRLESFCPGTAASVACLCGPGQIVPLAPCGQRLADDFDYRGGWLPLESALADRARRLARQAVQTLDGVVGYVGVDLILGDDPSGRSDIVVEINPRLTTSYVGLRALSEVNLAATMIAVAQQREVRLCWKSESIDFTSSGNCVTSSGRGNP